MTDTVYKEENKTLDDVNHPSHYNNGGMECIDEMIMLFGFEETMSFCKLNAWKYRARALDKGGRKDIEKSHWYLAKYKELKEIYEMRELNIYRTLINDVEKLANNNAIYPVEGDKILDMYKNTIDNI